MEDDYRYYFHNKIPFKVGDKVAYNERAYEYPVYKEVIITGEPYIASSGAQYINVLLKGKPAAVPTFDLANINTVKITNRADIYSDRYNNRDYSRRSGYMLVTEDNKVICKKECTGRKQANEILLDKELLDKYKITHVYSKGLLIWQK